MTLIDLKNAINANLGDFAEDAQLLLMAIREICTHPTRNAGRKFEYGYVRVDKKAPVNP